LIAVVVALPALFLSWRAFSDQQEINRSQAQINKLVEDRFERRYASRVSYWDTTHIADGGERISAITLQNRSPVPIQLIDAVSTFTAIHVDERTEGSAGPSGNASSFVVNLQLLPPCTLVVVSISSSVLESIADEAGGRVTLDQWRTDSIGFLDPVSDWRLSWTGLTKEPPSPYRRFFGPSPLDEASLTVYFGPYGEPNSPETVEFNRDVPVGTEPAPDCGESG